ncbi:hypothetical protein NUW54_g32 [Trametes sanguinea]|uniref:Uncharacterized protein n=1 Tax=Trametes sanguinea TaxID=158606 RepID=A0ACC1QCR5_9APHY|nr:hypothetical protein NUW54_g32 [Trametes sanguinea]
MQLCHPPRRHSFSRSIAVCTAASSRPYSGKVRGCLFHQLLVVDPDVPAGSQHSLYAGPPRFRTWLRYLFPRLKINTLQPIDAVPIYLPTWVIDAEFEATAWIRDLKGQDAHYSKAHVHLSSFKSLMPGFIHPPLSGLNFMDPNLALNDFNTEVPTTAPLRQYDDVVRSLSMADATIAKLMRFETGSLKETMLAAYPILIPGYLAQYKVSTSADGDMTFSSFIEAHRSKGRSVIEANSATKSFFQRSGTPGLVVVSGMPDKSAHRFARTWLEGNQSVTSLHQHLLRAWLDRAIAQEVPLKRYRDRFFGKSESAAARKVDSQWADLRIRPFETEERDANEQWLLLRRLIRTVKRSLDAYYAARKDAQMQSRDGTAPQEKLSKEAVEKAIARLEMAIEPSKEAHDEINPAWVAEYERQQGSPATRKNPMSTDGKGKRSDNIA